MKVGIRREDKHDFERRVPLTPEAVAELTQAGVEVVVQPSPIRAYDDATYAEAGATVDEDLSSCDVVFAVKEIPSSLFRRGGAYVFFSHTIKGQPYNMPMLRRLMELECTLFDYEKITDDEGRRLVFFGRHAGLAGMVDTLSVIGRRLAHLGHDTPLADLALTHRYAGLEEARGAVQKVGEQLAARPFPEALAPFVVGFAGYGNVSRGAQEIAALLPHETVTPEELAALVGRPDPPRDRIFSVVFEERHLVEPKGDEPFDLQTYYDHPDRFRSIFAAQARRLSVLVNAIYWTEAYPRLVTLDDIEDPGRLVGVGDISCDIDGAVQCTLKATTPDAPAYVYDPAKREAVDGVDGPGVVMMTTDCLPCELPREASAAFTSALLPFVPAIASAQLDGPLDAAGLPGPIRRACILHRGRLTEPFEYMAQFLG